MRSYQRDRESIAKGGAASVGQGDVSFVRCPAASRRRTCQQLLHPGAVVHCSCAWLGGRRADLPRTGRSGLGAAAARCCGGDSAGSARRAARAAAAAAAAGGGGGWGAGVAAPAAPGNARWCVSSGPSLPCSMPSSSGSPDHHQLCLPPSSLPCTVQVRQILAGLLMTCHKRKRCAQYFAHSILDLQTHAVPGTWIILSQESNSKLHVQFRSSQNSHGLFSSTVL